jgi:solute:Na+ symporter, SSS family
MTLEYIILGAYGGVLILLGAIFSRFTNNLSDFVRGGAQGTWWMAGTSMLMAGVSAFTFTGNASAAFEAGPTFLIIYVANCAAFFIGWLFLAAWFRQTRAYTGMDVVRTRFGVVAEQFAVYTGLLMGPMGAAIQLWALAVFAAAVFGYPLVPTIVVIGIIVTLYSAAGGRWAVMATDFAQGLIMFAITILVAVLALKEVGGVGAFFAYFSDPRFADDFRFVKEPGAFSDNRFSWKWIVVIFFMQIYAQINLGTSTRYLAVKDGREARWASLLAFFLMGFGTLIWFLPPMVARFLYGDEIMAQALSNPAESSYAFIARKLLPNGMMGLMIAAMFAATMSSIDSGLSGQVGVIMRNLLPALRSRLGFKQPLPPGTEVFLCKAATILLGGFIIFASVLFSVQQDIILFDAYLIIGSVIGIPLAFPLLSGLWVKRLPSWSYFAIFMACLIPSLISFYDARVNGNPWTIQDRAMWVFIAGIISTALCVPFYSRSSVAYKKRVTRFFELMHTPVDYAKEIGRSRDYEQLRIMGFTTMGIGCAILGMLLVPNPLSGRLAILGVAAFVIAVGLFLCRAAVVEKRRQALVKPTEFEGELSVDS